MIYADLESFIKKILTLSTANTGEHSACAYSISAI